VIASRRVGNAIKRNYGKRVFREIFRKHAAEFPEGSECVIVLRAGYDRESYEQLEGRFLKVCKSVRNQGNQE
jgi:ribonuclease P protein component